MFFNRICRLSTRTNSKWLDRWKATVPQWVGKARSPKFLRDYVLCYYLRLKRSTMPIRAPLKTNFVFDRLQMKTIVRRSDSSTWPSGTSGKRRSTGDISYPSRRRPPSSRSSTASSSCSDRSRKRPHKPVINLRCSHSLFHFLIETLDKALTVIDGFITSDHCVKVMTSLLHSLNSCFFYWIAFILFRIAPFYNVL